MPILDLQRRLHERGRIRIGEKDAGRGFPKKLDTFRFTSPDQQAIADAAALWGGNPEPWDSPNGAEHQVVTKAKSIPVLIPPGTMAFSQWLETWSAGGCQKRCDGQWDHKREKACDCDPENRECRETTRLSVVLPDLPGVGLWRIESHGYYAAVELSGAVELLQSLAPGALVPGRLWLDPRSVKREKRGGGVETRRFVVPVLDIEGTMKALPASGPALAALSAPIVEGQPNGGLTPVPVAELAAGPQRSVADQLGAEPEPPRRRSNAAEPIPSTGVSVRRGPAIRPEVVEGGATGGDVDNRAEAVVVQAGAVGAGGVGTPAAPVPLSAGVDLADLEALMAEREVGRVAVRKEYNRLAREEGAEVAARFEDMAAGPLLDAVYLWVEGQQPDPGPGGPAVVAALETAGGGDGFSMPGGTAPAPSPDPDQSPLPLSDESPTEFAKTNRRMQKRATEASGVGGWDRDLLRRTVAWNATNGERTSWKELSASELLRAETTLDSIVSGSMCIRETSDPAWPEGWQVDFAAKEAA